MTLLAPAWLLVIPAAALLLFAVRARDARRVVEAADFLLWRRAAARLPAAATRARPSWRDVAWIAPIVLLALGLARPEFARGPAAAPVHVLLDDTASMQTRAAPGGPTRAERGLDQARGLLGTDVPINVERTRDEVDGIASAAALLAASGAGVLVITDHLPPGLPESVGLVVVRDDARNAGIVAAGFDPERGLLVRTGADPGAGARRLSIAGGGTLTRALDLQDAAGYRVVINPDEVAAIGAPITIRLEPGDALAADDAVTLDPVAPPLRVAIAPGAPVALARALRAHPRVHVVEGDDSSAARFLAAPLRGEFETAPPVALTGALSGSGVWDGLTGPTTWPAVHPLARAPSATETLLTAGGVPLLVRHGRTCALLVDPEANGWSSMPSFPLTIARAIDLLAGLQPRGLEPRDAVLSSSETRVHSDAPAVARPPLRREAPRPALDLAPWCYAAAGLLMAVLVATLLRRR